MNCLAVVCSMYGQGLSLCLCQKLGSVFSSKVLGWWVGVYCMIAMSTCVTELETHTISFQSLACEGWRWQDSGTFGIPLLFPA